jgi:hypothetical protein
MIETGPSPNPSEISRPEGEWRPLRIFNAKSRFSLEFKLQAFKDQPQ